MVGQKDGGANAARSSRSCPGAGRNVLADKAGRERRHDERRAPDSLRDLLGPKSSKEVDQSMQCAVDFHECGGELNDMQKLEHRKQEKNNFNMRKSGNVGARGSEDAGRNNTFV